MLALQLGTAGALLFAAGHYAGLRAKAFAPSADREATPPVVPSITANPLITKVPHGTAGEGTLDESEQWHTHGTASRKRTATAERVPLERDVLGMPIGPLVVHPHEEATTALQTYGAAGGRARTQAEWPVPGSGPLN